MTLATGGTETTATVNGVTYKIHTFTSSGTLTISEGGQVEYLVVAGGGGGGSYEVSGDGGGGGAGGGGGGGVLYGTGYSVNANTTIPVTIGAGGAVAGNGVNSLFGTATAIGGGRGAFFVVWNGGQNGVAGGSGGGGSGNYYQGWTGGEGTAGQGNTGGSGATFSNSIYKGAGGGGAGAVGGNAGATFAGNGGAGAAYTISGNSVFYGGGGGGGAIQESGASATGGDGGEGGGGTGIRQQSTGRAPSAGTGGLGGGGGAGAAGGAGVVIVRYAFSEPVVVQDIVVASGGTETTVTVNNEVYRVHTFTTSGTLTVSNGGEFEYLIVAGGGGAPVSGDGNAGIGAGGGGGVLSGNVVFNTGSTIAVTVGAGGVNSNGSNSSLINLPVAIGGGRGGVFASAGLAGGSGGGGGGRLDAGGGAGTAGQGNNGGAARSGNTGGQSAGGGGGGAGAAGSKGGSAIGGNGGDGAASLITGVLRYYGGGGGGMANGTGGAGGLGGGGIGVSSGGSGTYAAGGAGGVNTGGGSGGGNAGGTGGSGIVILRYVFVEPVLEPEITTVSGGEGGVGGPFAGGGGGGGGYIVDPASTVQLVDDNVQNQDVLAITANGTNTAQNSSFVDSSTNNFNITRFGNTTQGSFSPYSPASWSGHFDGSGDYLSIPANSAFAFGTGDYTIEFYLYPKSSADFCIVDTQGSGGNAQISRISGAGFYHGSATPWNYTFTNNVWTHIAFSRSGTDLRLFANGVLIQTQTNSSIVGSSTNAFEIGRRIDGSYPLNGYISNLRVVKGTAVYTADFTPPTEPLTAIAGTSLLTCMDNRFVDRSANNFAISRFGDARTIVFPPFPSALYNPTVHGGSAFFDGSGDYLSLPFSENTAQWFDADYTIEMWLYNTVNAQSVEAGLPLQVAFGVPTTGETYWSFGTNTAGVLYFYYYNGGPVTNAQSVATVPLNSWNHVAMVYTNSNTTLRGYINGVQVFSVARSGTPQAPSGRTLNIGTVQSGGYRGYISNLRVVKGTAVYTAAFTPPTAPLGAIAGTSLLLNFTNAAIVDVSGKNNIETLNGAQVSTSVSKYGSGSMFFDGVDDRLVIPNNPNLVLAGGPWTVECWIYFTGTYGNYRAIFCKRTGVTATSSYQGYIQINTGLLSFFNGVEYASTAQVTANQWHHCAWVYTGTNIEIYFNGVRVLNTAVTITEVDQPLRLGSLDGNVEPYVGYIDDFRITKGVARYNTTFTPPDEIYQVSEEQSRGAGASGSALQSGEDNSLGGGAGGGSSETVAGGGGGVEVNGLVLNIAYTASGGTITTYTDENLVAYTQHTFTSSGTFETAAELNAEVLVVAGGGGGGYNAGAGGGAGGMIVESQTVAAGTYTIIVGAGGAGRTTDVGTGDQGSNSTWFNLNAIGGGGGKSSAGSGANGGSGGGAAAVGTGGSGIAGQGFAGGNGTGADGASRSGGGGGGAGAVGSNQGVNNGAGGIGREWPTGSTVYYAGGGGGAPHSGSGGAGGLGGGGAGGTGGSSNGTPGTENTGGGGGAGGGYGFSGASGGSGIVIVRYTQALFTLAQGGDVDEDGAGSGGALAGVDGNGGLYGGGGGGTTNSVVDPLVGNGAGGAIRIVWPAAREYPFPYTFPTTVTNVITGSLQTTTVRIDTPAQTIPMVTTTVPVTESLSWVDNASSVYEIGTTVTYDPKFSVDSPRPVPLSPFVSTKELQILVTEIDHELMLVNNDAKNLATWDDPTRYEKIDRVTLENDPRRITVRLLNYVIGVTGEGALVPTQIQTWF